MQILHVASELYPLVKTGGLGDVLAALPPALRRAGIDARLLLPGFPDLLSGIRDQTFLADLGSGPGGVPARLRLGRVAGNEAPCYLIDAPALFDRPGSPYFGPDGRDWPDNHRRFALLGWAAAQAAIAGFAGWRPDIVHGHDWHAGLAPAFLAAAGRPAASVFTIHNLAFQGVFPAEIFGELQMPSSFFAIDGIEFYGQVSFMKAALQFADRITTVSPTYAREIRQPDLGAGFDGLLRARSADVSGILNGVDYEVWNPAADPHLPRPFDAAQPAGKREAKAALQREMGLGAEPGAPLFGAVTRLTGQKGFDLMLSAFDEVATNGGQLALLGSGERGIEQGFVRMAAEYPGRLAVRIGYDEALAHRIIGGADCILVPSRFEPCGLTQLYGLRYGALPLVRRTGGLADTVVDANEETLAHGTATGFTFEAPDVPALSGALRRALRLYRTPAAWSAVRHRAMTRRFGWDEAAAQYAALYQSLTR